MDSASMWRLLWRLIDWRRPARRAAREPDPAEMGTAYGMEASLAPSNWSESGPPSQMSISRLPS